MIVVFSGRWWFRSQSECKEFSRDKTPEGKFQWSIHIIIYMQFVIGKTVYILDSQRDKVYAANIRKTKEQYIVISAFKTDIPPIMGGLVEDI